MTGRRQTVPVGEAARAAIAKAAVACIGAEGLEACSIAAVAHAAGTAKASVLYHFGSRDGLLSASVDAALVPWWRAQGEAMRQAGDPRSCLDAWLAACFAIDLPALRLRTQIATADPNTAAARRIADAERELELGVIALLSRGHRDQSWRAARPEQTALLVLGLVDGTLLHALRSGEASALAALRAVVRSALLDLLVRP